ncbi:heat shock 70 kDa protein 12A-like [Saccostrea echinata]|uniref:heat shock 70 kDa protein 12A-like n=1 Tax=Saccostrea echinata TaxID=191078 RepID=UPI002A801468|nr:heat shock 70 kDa protein 12A-like [Saccostrea echinata]
MSEIEIIIAIKFGTNYSTNAYMINDGRTEDPKLFTVPFQKHATSSMSLITPTVALFTENGVFQSYGFDAEYQNLQQGDKNKYLLFRDFVWDLFCVNDEVPKNLKAVNEKEMKSIDVMSAVLSYMDGHVKVMAGKHSIDVSTKYVLTVPTCSCNDSRGFMLEAAEHAGFPSDKITIVEEAAAALYFCIQNPVLTGLPRPTANQDKAYVFVECEDDNTNISVLKCPSEESINIIYRDNAEIWATCQVQKDFEELFALIVSESFLNYFLQKYPMEYYDIIQELKKKINSTPSDTQRVTMKMPAFLMEKFRKKTGKSIEKAVRKTILENNIEFKLDKCKISPDVFQSLFSDAGKHIVEYMEKELLTKYPDVDYLILIGEFAQSPILQNIIKESFPSKTILIPPEAGLAAVKGAVLFGQKHVYLETVQCPRRSRTPDPEDTGQLEEVVQSPRSYRAGKNDVTNLSATNELFSDLQRVVPPSEKRNRSRLCVIQ